MASDKERLDYMHEAPEMGYQDIMIDHPRDDPNWDPKYTGLLYLKARNGQIYAKMLFGMNTGWDERGVPFLG